MNKKLKTILYLATISLSLLPGILNARYRAHPEPVPLTQEYGNVSVYLKKFGTQECKQFFKVKSGSVYAACTPYMATITNTGKEAISIDPAVPDNNSVSFEDALLSIYWLTKPASNSSKKYWHNTQALQTNYPYQVTPLHAAKATRFGTLLPPVAILGVGGFLLLAASTIHDSYAPVVYTWIGAFACPVIALMCCLPFSWLCTKIGLACYTRYCNAKVVRLLHNLQPYTPKKQVLLPGQSTTMIFCLPPTHIPATQEAECAFAQKIAMSQPVSA